MFGNNILFFEFRGPFGIPIQIANSILLLVLFYIWMAGSDLLWALGVVSILLVSIVLHELGHGWAAQVQGVPVRRIVIHGGGGFCERKRAASAYEQEFIVAMGPIVNLAIWAVASLWSDVMWAGIFVDANFAENPQELFAGPRAQAAEWLSMIAYINGFLALFNLIPVQPLDGGKLLQLILLRLVSARAALRVTGAIGLALSVIWIPAMLLIYWSGGWLLFFIPSIPYHWALMQGRLA